MIYFCMPNKDPLNSIMQMLITPNSKVTGPHFLLDIIMLLYNDHFVLFYVFRYFKNL